MSIKAREKTIKNVERIVFLFSFMILFGLNSCKKKDPAPTPPTAAELAAGIDQKTWGIEKLSVNDTLIALDADQLKYTKTYRRDSTFQDSDGLQGRWLLSNNNTTLTETALQGGQGTWTYKVETLNEASLRIRLISDGTDTYNTLYEFRAK
jgi:hypothetical protein